MAAAGRPIDPGFRLPQGGPEPAGRPWRRGVDYPASASSGPDQKGRSAEPLTHGAAADPIQAVLRP